MTPQQATLYEAVGNLIKAKGRFHTEQNYAALVVAFDAETASRRAPAPTSEQDEAELAEWRRLKDPAVLHASLLRGQPARLPDYVFQHIAGVAPTSEPGARDLIAGGALRQYRHNDGSEGFVFGYDKEITDRLLATPASPAVPDDPDHLLRIIAFAYQIAGAHDAPEHILDILADPEGATPEQVDAMLPYQAAPADPAPLVAQASPDAAAWRRPGFEPEFTADSLLAAYWARKGSTVTPLYEHPVPEASPLVEDEQRIVAGKVEL